MSKFLPMRLAPKDGSEVRLYNVVTGWVTAHWDAAEKEWICNHWRIDGKWYIYPSKWAPLTDSGRPA